MSKSFFDWNNKKQIINDSGKIKLYHARDIWWCHLGKNIGYEQDGSGKEYQRPVLIIKGFSKNVCLIAPLTTKIKKINKYYVLVGKVDKKQASVIISQIRLIDTRRLINKIGVLDKEKFSNITKAVRDLI